MAGAILLYDVTCEASFLAVRDWVESVEDSATKKCQIIICGNKVDLREDHLAKGLRVVSR